MQTLLIDDEKDPRADPLLRELGEVHCIARSYAEGIAALARHHWDRLLLDHDLADFSGPAGAELTGRSIVRWLAQPENRRHIPGQIICVSRNVRGIRDINADVETLYRQPDQLLKLTQQDYERLFGAGD